MEGFIGTPTNELFAPWMSGGVFTPCYEIMRDNSEGKSLVIGDDIEEISRAWNNQRIASFLTFNSAFYDPLKPACDARNHSRSTIRKIKNL